jgi:hypothetical protein
VVPVTLVHKSTANATSAKCTWLSNCWGFSFTKPYSCWRDSFHLNAAFPVGISLLLAIAGGGISLECSICWGYFTIAGNCWGILLLLAIAGGAFHWNAAFAGYNFTIAGGGKPSPFGAIRPFFFLIWLIYCLQIRVLCLDWPVVVHPPRYPNVYLGQ